MVRQSLESFRVNVTDANYGEGAAHSGDRRPKTGDLILQPFMHAHDP